MAKQYMVVNDDQILVDMELIFSAIRDADGDWEQVEQDLLDVMNTVQGMVDTSDDEDEE
ncbi:hypothetical protein LRY65_00440 [Candidatus Woesebacteria bacterium]|nr:hypothetical protein [Candidatus Woesebacteria bacterium]MCD8507040.1 hypothetical protein [Candidatus Woesebacteria bacterium]MCD8526670.1 hypothetical protein [Candidatus Woesebacteria bacterium]MCD8546695.1 hypothetical protein [Candidatus Woesebacteria bacterium]